jgi:hypothetical protein
MFVTLYSLLLFGLNTRQFKPLRNETPSWEQIRRKSQDGHYGSSPCGFGQKKKKRLYCLLPILKHLYIQSRNIQASNWARAREGLVDKLLRGGGGSKRGDNLRGICVSVIVCLFFSTKSRTISVQWNSINEVQSNFIHIKIWHFFTEKFWRISFYNVFFFFFFFVYCSRIENLKIDFNQCWWSPFNYI